jgi:hypothetical protein
MKHVCLKGACINLPENKPPIMSEGSCKPKVAVPIQQQHGQGSKDANKRVAGTRFTPVQALGALANTPNNTR